MKRNNIKYTPKEMGENEDGAKCKKSNDDDDEEEVHYVIFNKKEYELLRYEMGMEENVTRYIVEDEENTDDNFTTYIDKYSSSQELAIKLFKDSVLYKKLNSVSEEYQSVGRTVLAALGLINKEVDNKAHMIKYTLYSRCAADPVKDVPDLLIFLLALDDILKISQHLFENQGMFIYDLKAENIQINQNADISILKKLGFIKKPNDNIGERIKMKGRRNYFLENDQKEVNVNLRCSNISTIDNNGDLDSKLISFKGDWNSHLINSRAIRKFQGDAIDVKLM